jgi:glycosyltransferase involved in cell wall biosynthesis
MYKPNVFCFNSSYTGCNYPRIYLPACHNGFRTDKPEYRGERMGVKSASQECKWADVVVFHRPETKEFYNLTLLLKKNGKKIVIDNDDTFKLDDIHPLANFNADATVSTLAIRDEMMDKMIRLADLVTTTTEFLANEYRKINPNVVVLPNCVDPDDWGEPIRNENGKVRIGIVGSAAIEYDYLHVKEVIRTLSKRKDVEIVMFGLGDKEHRKNNPIVTKVFSEEYKFWDSIKMEQVAWCEAWKYQEKLRQLRLDLMLIPRKNNYFNRCKSNIKFLEASMLKIPVIAQSFDGGPYEEITSDIGVLIKDDKDWMKEIERLINNKSLRRKIGKNAHKYVLKNYDINKKYNLWADAYAKLYEKN